DQEWSCVTESCLMAGEAVSRTSLTSAFQKKHNLEWRKLREHLHLQLQQDITRNLYTKCDVTNEEAAVRFLERIHGENKFKSDSPGLCSGDSGLSPESDIYLTPNSSPSEIFIPFEDKLTNKTETIINLQKTNRSYYKIVQVDEPFIEENNCKDDDVLERELAEQDELLKSFRSIKSKEEKKINVKKPIKPTSLPFTSSQYTKKKQSCDILNIRNKKEGKSVLDSKLQSSRCKEDLISVNFNYCAKKKDSLLVDKFENNIKEKEASIRVKKSLCYPDSNNDILEEEEFMDSPGEGMDCELECCKKKDIITEDLLNFPCSPEMDASGGGPDSGLDTSSTGCIPGGGFSSPREHTVSETSGVDLTEAAIGEDMPHDGDVEQLMRKPVKSSTSSSVSSDAGTWDSTFPSTNLTELDCVGGTEVPTNAKETETLSKSNEAEEKLCHEDALSQVENVDFKNNDEIKAQNSDIETLNLESKLFRENRNATFVIEREPVDSIPQECTKSTVDANYSMSSNIQGSSSEINSPFQSLGFCSDGSHSWKLSNQNNYFINAADLADDVEMLLPPVPVVSEEIEKIHPEIESPELEALPKSSGTPSPCEETISSTCDIVNKGIIDCFNIKAKYMNTETLPVEAHSDDVVPFLSSHLTDEQVLLNAKEGSFRTTNEEILSDPLLAKLTPFKATSGKNDLRTSSKQDIFAEFEKEIKMTEHLEPHVNIRKIHGSWKRMDSSSSDDLNKRESQSLPADIFSDTDRSENIVKDTLDGKEDTEAGDKKQDVQEGSESSQKRR
ncbi:hypothetical protein L9F63_012474, partial [Diploptera punctata]